MLILVLHRGYQQCLKMSQIRLSLISVYVCFLYIDLWYVVLWWWQIRLWESDLNRVEMTEAYYYDEFPSRVSNFDSASSCFKHKAFLIPYAICVAGCIWRRLWLRQRMEWFIMGRFKEDAFGGQVWGSYLRTRFFTPPKVVRKLHILVHFMVSKYAMVTIGGAIW